MLGRYALYEKIASGGMASVHIGRLLGPVGFARTVAIKRMHPQFAEDPEFVSMFLDEARLAARIRHPNVVPTLDIVSTDSELFLVMDFVQGESLARLIQSANNAGQHVPPEMVATIVFGLSRNFWLSLLMLGLTGALERDLYRTEFTFLARTVSLTVQS